MKPLITLLLLISCISTHAQDIELKTHNDSLSYAVGIVMSNVVFPGYADYIKTENDIESFFEGAEESLNDTISDINTIPHQTINPQIIGKVYGLTLKMFSSAIEGHPEIQLNPSFILNGLKDKVRGRRLRLSDMQVYKLYHSLYKDSTELEEITEDK